MSNMPHKGLDDQCETLEVISDEIRRRLERQSDGMSKIDTKAVILVGYAAALSSFLVTRHAELVLAIFAYLAFGGAAIAGISVFAVGGFRDSPAPRTLFEKYLMRPKSDVLAAISATRVAVFEKNVARHRRKAQVWRLSLAALLAGVLLMLLSIVVHNG